MIMVVKKLAKFVCYFPLHRSIIVLTDLQQLYLPISVYALRMDLFPYEPRKNQTAIMQTIKNTLNVGKNIVFESGTGSGKTICTLT